ncbi:hypothetical protein B0H11DRAFT_2027095 [Mycena galericulata]|nr:hypothetical protein B0H11DRAFT_2027095 [Mycena galericulata]
MTEYDASPEAYNQYRRTQVRIAHWVDDTVHSAPHFKSPFLPRSDVQDNEFYNPRSGSPHRHTPSPSHSQSSSHGHGRRAPQRSHSQGYGYNPPPAQPQFRSPLRAQTISVVSPNDSISQASGPTQSHRRRSLHRSHSSSPTRHSSHRSHRHSSGGAYVVSGSPQYGQYNSGQYVQPPQQIQYASQQQPAAYIVHPRDRKVQIVYPDPTHHAQYPPVAYPAQEHHASLLQRIFGSQSGKRSRSLSLGHSRERSSSRSRR